MMKIENVYGIKLSPAISSELQKKHPELCYMFRMFLKKWLGGEYWQMWMEVDKFKEMELDPVHTRIAATQIFDKYWSPASEYHIDIRPKVKEQLAQKIDTGNVGKACFDEALKELELESYKKFLRSDEYAGFMADKGVFVRTSSPKRRVSITELFKKKSRAGSSSLRFSAEIDDSNSTFSLEGSLNASGCLSVVEEHSESVEVA